MAKSDQVRAAAALISASDAYFLAFLIYGVLGGEIEPLSRAGFLFTAAVLWVLVGAAFDRLWVAAVPLVPYLGFKLSTALSGTAVYYGENAVTMEQLLVVSAVALALGWVLRGITERLLSPST